MLHGGAVTASHSGFRRVRAGPEKLGLGLHEGTEKHGKSSQRHEVVEKLTKEHSPKLSTGKSRTWKIVKI